MSGLSFSCSANRCSPENTAIEERMELAKQTAENTMRVLLVGSRNSGKTTILTQIQRIKNKYDAAHLSDRRKIITNIQSAVVEYMQILCVQSDILHKKYDKNTSIDAKYNDLCTEILQLKAPFNLTPEIGSKIQTLWRDKGVKETLRHRCLFQMDDNVQYFLDKVQEISAHNYLPEFDDYLRFRQQQSIGIGHTQITLDDHTFEFIDIKGSNRCERKKWIHFSGDVDAILYVLPISDYDLFSDDEHESNCLVEALHSFREVMIEANFFTDKLLVVLFNKFDAFKEKIKRVPITVAFDEFPVREMDAKNESDVIRFVASKLYSVFEEQRIETTSPLRIIRTTALNRVQIESIVSDISYQLIQRKVKNDVM